MIFKKCSASSAVVAADTRLTYAQICEEEGLYEISGSKNAYLLVIKNVASDVTVLFISDKISGYCLKVETASCCWQRTNQKYTKSGKTICLNIN